MSAAASEPTPSGEPRREEPGVVPFVERDDRETAMPYDKGGVPIYVIVAWVLFIAAYVTVMSVLALPDLRAWMSH